jgi:AcrR family transcriptional regulator
MKRRKTKKPPAAAGQKGKKAKHEDSLTFDKNVRDPSDLSSDAVARRIPLQERSRARVERILDTAAELFISVGYDAATTEQIAAKAGTSIGSIYQFFPNKRAMFDAIAARHLSDASGLFEQFIGVDADSTPWRVLLERTIDAYTSYHRQNLGFRAILMNWKLSPEFLEAGEMLNREFARRAAMILKARAPHLDDEQLAAASTLAVELMSAVLIVSVRMTEEEAQMIFKETKTMLVRYLTPYMNAPAEKNPAHKKKTERARKRAP